MVTGANFCAIHSLGESLTEYLQRAYDRMRSEREDGGLKPALPTCNFALLSSEAMADTSGPARPTISLYLYRVTVNEHLRNAGSAERPPPLALDLHYLLTAWVNDVADEHRILGWLLQSLHSHQTLSGSDLTPEGGWQRGECVHMVPAELSNEDLMRVWDALKRPYHLSLSYIARVVRMGAAQVADSVPVVAQRIAFGMRVDEP